MAINDIESRMELDLQANMTVIGKHSYVLNWTGQTAQVSPFSPEYEAMDQVPIVDMIIAYDCPYALKTYLLVCHNALYIPSMDHNLFVPFIMREAGVKVNDIPKIQVHDPLEKDHSVWFPEMQVRIPLSLSGIFSFFPTRSPTVSELQECEDVLVVTPDGHKWDPHSDVYAQNEESMLDWEGNLSHKKDQICILVEDLMRMIS